MKRHQLVRAVALVAVSAINASQLWAAGHVVWSVAFGMVAPIIDLREYVVTANNERPEPWRMTTESERLLGWLLALQVALMPLWS